MPPMNRYVIKIIKQRGWIVGVSYFLDLLMQVMHGIFNHELFSTIHGCNKRIRVPMLMMMKYHEPHRNSAYPMSPTFMSVPNTLPPVATPRAATSHDDAPSDRPSSASWMRFPLEGEQPGARNGWLWAR